MPRSWKRHKQVQKHVWIVFGFGSLWAPLLLLLGVMFLFVFKHLFVHTFSPFWHPKVTPRLPKWSHNGVEIVSVGTLWEVLEPWYLLYGRHMRGSGGSSGRQLFPACVSRRSLEASSRAFLLIFRIRCFRCVCYHAGLDMY